jgi:hypothetical protein
LVAAITTIVARLEPVPQREQLRDEALLGLARDLAALGRDRIDLVDEHDRRRGLGGFVEHLAQPRFGFAIGRAHDLGAVDQMEGSIALVGDRPGKPRLARAGRAVEQHALGRIDAEPLEQFGIAQRQLDHLAKLVDRRGHPADIVIGHVGAARVHRFLILRTQLDLGVLVDMDDALGQRRDHRKADFLQRIGRRAQHLGDLRGHVGALLDVGRDDVALAEGPAEKGALERFARTLEAQILLRRREDDARRGLRLDLADLDIVARADSGIDALEPIDAQDLEPLVLGIGEHRPGRGAAFADDLDDIALGDAERTHQAARQMREAAAAVLRPRIGDLQLVRGFLFVGHGLLQQ